MTVDLAASQWIGARMLGVGLLVYVYMLEVGLLMHVYLYIHWGRGC